MVQCWAFGCANRSEHGFKVHCFPKKSDPRYQVWVNNVGRLDPSSNPRTPKLLEPANPRSTKLCEVHFDESCYTLNADNGNKVLSKSAIPTLFPHKQKRTEHSIRPPNKRSREIEETEQTESVASATAPEDEEVLMLKAKLARLEGRMRQVNQENVRAQSSLRQQQKSIKKIFNDDQLTALTRRSTRGMKWSSETVKRALRMRFSCGTTGYNQLITDQHMPLPSVRTLQERLQHVNFNPDILHSVFAYLETKVQNMEDRDKLCCLTLDEMEISPSIEYDPSCKQVIGDVTLKDHEGQASHGLAVMLGGVAERWKQVVAYHLTGRSIKGGTLADLAKRVISKACDIGLRVIVVTSDMGPANQAMWKTLGISAGKDEISTSISFPDENRKVYFMADVPHLVKNLCTAFLTHRRFVLPTHIVSKYELPTAVISLDHVECLINFQKDKQLMLAPNLSSESIKSTGHFRKMNVGNALNVFSKSVSAGLQYLVDHANHPRDFLTTAWFINEVDKWFDLMSSRHPVCALSKKKMAEFTKAKEGLENFCLMMTDIEIGAKPSWKPVQKGILLSTKSVLEISDELLPGQLDFLLTSRLTQDCVENLFSSVRSKNPTPTPREFKYALKTICVAQYLKPVGKSNYQQDDREYLGDLLPAQIILPEEQIDDLELTSQPVLEKDECQSLYYLCGYCCISLLKQKRVCQKCLDKLSNRGEAHDYSGYLKSKNFKDGALFEVSSEVYEQILEWELIIRQHEPSIKHTKIHKILSNKCTIKFDIVSCHPIYERLKHKFINMRLHFMCKRLAKNVAASSGLGSKSMAMRQLAKKMK